MPQQDRKRLLQDILQQVVEAAKRLMLQEGLKLPPTMLADLPCNLFSVGLDSPGSSDVVESVARSLAFTPSLERMADKVRAGIGAAYNGLHLRIEKDARDWATLSGGSKNLETLYWRACRHNAFGQVRRPSSLMCLHALRWREHLYGCLAFEHACCSAVAAWRNACGSNAYVYR